MVELTRRIRGVDAPRVARSTPEEYRLGQSLSFWTKDLDTGANTQIEAILRYQSDALLMWVEEGVRVSQSALEEAAAQIEDQILPTNRAYFGNEWQPGVDGDDRIHILHLQRLGGAGAAYFWSGDEYVKAVNPFSNQHEMLYVNLQVGRIGSDIYFGNIAHELLHLIQWQGDRNEDAWQGEGLGELASYINGYGVKWPASFLQDTDVQLTLLEQEPGKINAHYGAATLFCIYFLERFGEQAVQLLAKEPENGAAGFAKVLQVMGEEVTFEDLFSDWLVANYLQGVDSGEHERNYPELELPAIRPIDVIDLPASGTGSVHQYGADYLRMTADVNLTFEFTGTQQVDLVDALPHSGDHYWVSTPGDESDMRLTRQFDLTSLHSATLDFWTWFDIEDGWDYGYVAASGDGGQSWDLLETDSVTRENPQGNILGPGFTGKSGNRATPSWINESADLTPYAGGTVTIRFQYLTDAAVYGQGMIIDDVSIPELSYQDGFEADKGGWHADGFALTGQALPQSYSLQLVLMNDHEYSVQRLYLDANRRGQFPIPLEGRYDNAIVIIAGTTPVTRATAAYAYHVTRANPNS